MPSIPLIDLLEQKEDSIWIRGQSIKYQNPSDREPYIWREIDSDTIKPISAFFSPRRAAIDTERMFKFTASGKGLMSLAKQQLLHLQAPFDETNIANPLVFTQGAAFRGSLGFIPRPQKHLSAFGLAGILSIVGIDAGGPTSTVGAASLPDENRNSGGAYGLIRGNTASEAHKNLLAKWQQTQGANSSVKSAFSNFATGLISSMKKKIVGTFGASSPDGTYRADEGAYDLMISDANHDNGVSRLQRGSGLDNTQTLHKYSNTMGEVTQGAKASTSILNPVGFISSQLTKLFKTNAPSSTSSSGNMKIAMTIYNPYNRFKKSVSETLIQPVEVGHDGSYGAIQRDLVSSEESILLNFYTDWVNDSIKSSLKSNDDSGLKAITEQIERALGTGDNVPSWYNPLSSKQYGNRVAAGAKYLDPPSKISDESNVTLRERSREKYYGFGNYGLDKDKAGQGYITRIDKVNATDVYPLLGETPEEVFNKDGIRDLIKFGIHDVVNNNLLVFRSTIKSINDNFTAEWNDLKYIGRADRSYIYSGHTRDLSFTMRVYATSKVELPHIWSKIDCLTGLTEPSNFVDSQDFTINIPPLVKLTLGDMYKAQPAIIRNVGLTVPDEANWEIDNGIQYPMMVDINLSFTILNRSKSFTGRNRYGDINDIESEISGSQPSTNAIPHPIVLEEETA
jgi:hypothetical protein